MYTELAKTILPFRDRQGELIQLLKELAAKGFPVGSTVDEDARQNKFPLTTIDPFTFFTTRPIGPSAGARLTLLQT